jgi:hypothetical protein
MALSGSVSTNAHDGRYMKVSWTGTPDAPNNRTLIAWTINAVGGNDGWYTTGPVKLKINGSWVYWDETRIDMRTTWSTSGTTWVNHNEDGTKSFGIRLEAAVELYAINCTGEGTFTLDPIARNPDAPTAFTADAGHGSTAGVGDTVTLAWSGASGVITGYEIQVNRAGAGWTTLKSITSSATSGSTTDKITITDISKTGAGKSLQYRIRAMNNALPSAWFTAATLTMSGGADIKVNGSWKTGSVWRNVGGTWKRAARVYKKISGTWEQSK